MDGPNLPMAMPTKESIDSISDTDKANTPGRMDGPTMDSLAKIGGTGKDSLCGPTEPSMYVAAFQYTAYICHGVSVVLVCFLFSFL